MQNLHQLHRSSCTDPQRTHPGAGLCVSLLGQTGSRLAPSLKVRLALIVAALMDQLTQDGSQLLVLRFCMYKQGSGSTAHVQNLQVSSALLWLSRLQTDTAVPDPASPEHCP